MKEPNAPKNEQQRLRTLESLNILDTEPEERFDCITRKAQSIFGVPIALVSLIDKNRQWFKSCTGLSVRQTPRDISFCGHAILDDEILIVPDATIDERFVDNPLVTDDPNIRFYAGCPLTASDGSRLGTLCIIDIIPRSLNVKDLTALKKLAALVEGEILAGKPGVSQWLNRFLYAFHSIVK